MGAADGGCWRVEVAALVRDVDDVSAAVRALRAHAGLMGSSGAERVEVICAADDVADSSVRERVRAACLDLEWLGELLEGVQPGGELRVRVSGAEEAVEGLSSWRAVLQQRLRMAGWNVAEDANSQDGAAAGWIVARRPAAADSVLGAAVPLTASDHGTEYLDEEELLPSEALRQKVTGSSSAKAGCGAGDSQRPAGRQPCANCTCGLKEQTEGKQAPPDPLQFQPRTGACNSCNLGDAFRCANCPYLGLPPFRAGESVKLDASIITSDL